MTTVTQFNEKKLIGNNSIKKTIKLSI